jgi:GNAT superfamily N-acetyltransferase
MWLVILPAGFSMRPVTVDDSDVITELINTVTTAEAGFAWTNLEETRSDFSDPVRKPEDHDVIVLDADGAPAAYLRLYLTDEPYEQAFALVYTDPRWWGRGISTFLLGLGEERARGEIDRAPPGSRVVFQVARFATVTAAAALFESLGFSSVRTFWTMRIDLDDAAPPPTAVEGITLRPLEPTTDTRSVYDALAEAFADHWGHAFPSFERWRYTAIRPRGPVSIRDCGSLRSRATGSSGPSSVAPARHVTPARPRSRHSASGVRIGPVESESRCC